MFVFISAEEKQGGGGGSRDNLSCPDRNSPAIIVSQVVSLFPFYSRSVTIGVSENKQVRIWSWAKSQPAAGAS